jgi:hypothetical protein
VRAKLRMGGNRGGREGERERKKDGEKLVKEKMMVVWCGGQENVTEGAAAGKWYIISREYSTVSYARISKISVRWWYLFPLSGIFLVLPCNPLVSWSLSPVKCNHGNTTTRSGIVLPSPLRFPRQPRGCRPEPSIQLIRLYHMMSTSFGVR